ncbi:MAG: transcription termination factor NusA [Rhodospirillaceae bacterium]|jgi:N utilization substance protein A|nr:transcription termination factor NusA [Rhodospirillaceae bacterium]
MEQTIYQRNELLQIADAVARDKGIDRDEILIAMEQAIQKVGCSKYGYEYDIRAHIDRKTGEIKLLRFMEIVETVVNETTQIDIEHAKLKKSNAILGDFIIDYLPPIDYGRVAAYTAKRIIVKKVHEIERQHQFFEFKNRIGEIVSGLVKRVEFGNVIIDLSRAEALLTKDNLIPRETFRIGDRVRAYINDVRQESKGPQIFLSRTHPQFMGKLFTQEVPEIYDGIIEIKKIARDPGSRAKIAVISRDSGIDPVGSCIGVRGSRVQVIVAELQGEKVDIIPWSSDPITFVVNSLVPAEVTRVILDEEVNRIEVIVSEDQLSLAIGRRGQNVRLASQLTGWNIDILTEDEESNRRTKEFKLRSDLFIEVLSVDDVIARLLIAEGFSSVEEIALVPLDNLIDIEGFDETTANDLQQRARDFLEERDKHDIKCSKELGVTDDLAKIVNLPSNVLLELGKNGIKTLDDLADLANDELIEIIGSDKLSLNEANDIIIKARAHWFDDQIDDQDKFNKEEIKIN